MSVIVTQYITAPWNWSSDGVFYPQIKKLSNMLSVSEEIFSLPFSSGWREFVLLPLVFKDRAGDLSYALDVGI